MPPKKRQSKQKNSTANVAAEASPSNSMAISVENASLDDLIQGYWASDAAQHVNLTYFVDYWTNTKIEFQ